MPPTSGRPPRADVFCHHCANPPTRYAIVNVTSAGSKPWDITAFRRVCQVVPTNYQGTFHSTDPMLEQIWHTGAYTTKVTLVGKGLNSPKAFLGSELKDRGDRIAFLGDVRPFLGAILHVSGVYGHVAWAEGEWLAWKCGRERNANSLGPYTLGTFALLPPLLPLKVKSSCNMWKMV